jgi:hypothetical protein
MFRYAATWIAPSSAAGDCDVMTGPLQNQPDRDLHGRVVIHDQDVGQLKNPPDRMGSPATQIKA